MSATRVRAAQSADRVEKLVGTEVVDVERRPPSVGGQADDGGTGELVEDPRADFRNLLLRQGEHHHVGRFLPEPLREAGAAGTRAQDFQVVQRCDPGHDLPQEHGQVGDEDAKGLQSASAARGSRWVHGPGSVDGFGMTHQELDREGRLLGMDPRDGFGSLSGRGSLGGEKAKGPDPRI